LQLWHALTLLLVLVGFGSGLYRHMRQSQLDGIDGELHAAARALEGTLRGFPQQMLQVGDDPEPLSPPPPPGRSPRDPPAPPAHGPINPRHREQLLGRLALPESFRRRYEQDSDEAPYFAIWLANGQLLTESALPEGAGPLEQPTAVPSARRPFRSWRRGPFREGMLIGPNGTVLLVGRRVERELENLRYFAYHLVSVGLGVLAVGLIGGWLLSRGALRPIERMSAAAASISAANLSRRIDVTGVDRELAGLAGTLNDMFARLQAAFERQARFTADASHELRTPLSIIHSHTELALSRPRSPDEYRDALETSLRAAQRMRVLVEGLLTLARVDAGSLDLQRQELDLGAFVRECADLLRPLTEQKDVTLEVNADAFEMTGDPVRLAQVVTNLITNAIHYNRDGGKVTVNTSAGEQEIALSVADTGCGIPAEDQPHIFERFYRVDRARSREQGGCGLGLAICKSIVEAHGGAIGLTSEVGQGTTFVVRLPRKLTPAGGKT
jgi:heavy metal sensor kinase